METLGWETESQEFDAVDWIDGGATLNAGNKDFNVLVSPWTIGCSVRTLLESASYINELEKGNLSCKIIMLHGKICAF